MGSLIRTALVLFSTYETVARETPARRATSALVGTGRCAGVGGTGGSGIPGRDHVLHPCRNPGHSVPGEPRGPTCRNTRFREELPQSRGWPMVRLPCGRRRAPEVVTYDSRPGAAGLAECARALAHGEVSARAVERALARIEATQHSLNAFRAACAGSGARRGRRGGQGNSLLECAGRCSGTGGGEGRHGRGGRADRVLRLPACCLKAEDGEAVRPLAPGRRYRHRQDQHLRRARRCAPAAVHRGARLRRHPATPGTPSTLRAARPAARRRRSRWLSAAALGSDGAGSVRIPASGPTSSASSPQRGRISTWPRAVFQGITVNAPSPSRSRTRPCSWTRRAVR